MLIGYVRVSTNDQNTDLQRNALNCAGCERIFEDKISGTKSDRPGMKKLLRTLSAGDTLVVWKLDRLGRSMRHLVTLIEELRQRGVNTGEVQAVELVVRGRHKEVDSGEWKTGESNTTKVTSTNSYAKLTINGEVLYEVDLINMVEIVDGVDLMEAHRNALGL
ncbi:recombinase family protein [Escherichia coli]